MIKDIISIQKPQIYLIMNNNQEQCRKYHQKMVNDLRWNPTETLKKGTLENIKESIWLCMATEKWKMWLLQKIYRLHGTVYKTWLEKNTTHTIKKKKEKKGFIINLMPWVMQVNQLLKLSFDTSKTLNDDYRQRFQHFEP